MGKTADGLLLHQRDECESYGLKESESPGAEQACTSSLIGRKQRLRNAVNDHTGLEPDAS